MTFGFHNVTGFLKLLQSAWEISVIESVVTTCVHAFPRYHECVSAGGQAKLIERDCPDRSEVGSFFIVSQFQPACQALRNARATCNRKSGFGNQRFDYSLTCKGESVSCYCCYNGIEAVGSWRAAVRWWRIAVNLAGLVYLAPSNRLLIPASLHLLTKGRVLMYSSPSSFLSLEYAKPQAC